MRIDRRSFFLGSASVAAAVASNSLGFAQIRSREDEFRQQYGAPYFRNDIEALKYLKQAQDFGTIAPRDIKSYEVYLDNLPLMRLIKTGQGPELFHLIQWHAFSLELTALDHTTMQSGPNGPPDLLFAEQYGPHRASRALAIIHLAMFEAVNAIYQLAESYKDIQSAIFAETHLTSRNINPNMASVKAAIAAAAYETMVALYPHKTAFTQVLFDKLSLAHSGSATQRQLGSAIGASAARQVLLLRKYDFSSLQFGDGCQSDGKGGIKQLGPNDNSLSLEPAFADIYTMPSVQDWQVDPLHSTNMTDLGGYWSFVDTFVLDSEQLFLPPGPPPIGSEKFNMAYAAVRSLGGDPHPILIGDRYPTPTLRTGTGLGAPLDDSNETFKGIFWGYDGTNLLCAPPRLYNMIATSTALDEYPINHVAEMARYLALINLTLADAGIAAWTAKYKYNFTRPITYIRQNQPDRIVDGSANGKWTPLGAPITNGGPVGANTTPPFPAYPSGHAVFGGALFTAMRLLLPLKSRTETAFSFVSDEFNGLNSGPTGEIRPFVKRHFESFKAAEVENAQSRIWLGIHWQFDADDGREQGHNVANYIVGHALRRV